MIKKIFKKPENLDSLIQEMIGLNDINAQEMKIDKYTLKIHDKRLERKYTFSRKKKTIKFSRFFYLLILILATFYLIIALIIQPITNSMYYKIIPVILGYIAFGFTFTEFYSNVYDKAIISFNSAIILSKIICDWVWVSEIISLFTSLISIMSTCSISLNVNIFPIYLFNIANFISFFIRFDNIVFFNFYEFLGF